MHSLCCGSSLTMPSTCLQPRVVDRPRDLNAAEASAVRHFLLLRRQMHASPLYTSNRASPHDPLAPRKLYGLAQMNSMYDVRSRASLDPFTAVPTYSHKFVRRDRLLPDWTSRPVCRELFPAELLDTVEPRDDSGMAPRRRLQLTSLSSLPNAEEAFGMPSLATASRPGSHLLDKLDAIPDEDADEGADLDEAEAVEDDEDEVYDDEDAGDYDAENYFDNGDDMGDDYADGDDAEATY